ncbi:hypothetical protein [Bhargavaea beijingensis]|uniref:Uncharacterized protein n=1 Tax=Bhargavaea beijingensis TaxID=426756 RepID=A0ABX9ZDX3_9BACL|nr:hypothetical protein [Bhargavaea beijingensis]MCW1928054.1 hypothetical protein [Bhargavaea beijingensis]RSK34280.1 hypothetical protein EJA12_04940 [Bhargavaea beijingensis]
MTNPKLSLMEAYMVESLRGKGVPNDELFSLVEQGNVDRLKELEPRFDYNELVKAAREELDSFRSALFEGYKVKFVTLNGLKNLLRMRLGKEEGRDYSLTDGEIQGLRLSPHELEQFSSMLSSNWRMTSDEVGVVQVKLNRPAGVISSTDE